MNSIEPITRPARSEDVPGILSLIEPFVDAQQLLPRTEDEILKLNENGFVVEMEGRIVGYGAVELYSKKLAEVQCLAVAADCQGKGFGKILIRHCVERARDRGVYELMAITNNDAMFQKCGFDYSTPNQKRALFIHPLENASGSTNVERPDS
jgi:amino-acid N-acetyltransferase